MINRQFTYKCEDCALPLVYCITRACFDHESKPILIEEYHCDSCHNKDVHYIGKIAIYDRSAKYTFTPPKVKE